MHTALSIAGSDPSGGAGLQADLQVFRAHGVHGMGVVTALTVQDAARVHEVLPVFPSVVLKQLRAILRAHPPDAVKIGMLASDDVARNVDLGLRDLDPARRTPIVIDPLLAASDGSPLLERRAWSTLQDLIGRAHLVTPNLPEAAALAGVDVSTRTGVEAAAAQLVTALGARAALVKGGHRDGAPDDLLAIRQGGSASFEWLPGERVPGEPVHGTGCALSAAIAAHLARGVELREAILRAREFVREAIRNAQARFLVY
jgi:hydroxymethylpyrimidine/phosphomethylpyrimidine kinase